MKLALEGGSADLGSKNLGLRVTVRAVALLGISSWELIILQGRSMCLYIGHRRALASLVLSRLLVRFYMSSVVYYMCI